MRGRGWGWMAGAVVAAVVGACRTVATTTGAAAPPPLPLGPGALTASSELTPVAVPLAPPVESDAANGERVTRSQNSAIHWTAATRAWSVHGAIPTHWNGLGAERSTYGYPRSDQYAVGGGVRQDFQNGSLFVANGSSTVRRA